MSKVSLLLLVSILVLVSFAANGDLEFSDKSLISAACNHTAPQMASLSSECINPLLTLLSTETPIAGYDYKGRVIHRDVCHSFGHAICLESMTEPQCRECLVFLANNILNICGLSVGARVELPGCFLRYEEYEF